MFEENESRRSERKRDAAGNPRRRMALIGHGTVLGGNRVSGCSLSHLIAEPHARRHPFHNLTMQNKVDKAAER
jgi:hypothetical protein